MTAYPNVRAVAPQLVDRLVRAVESRDVAALGALDGEVRRVVAALLAGSIPEPAAVLGELADLYRMQLTRCEADRDRLKRSIGAQQRARAGVSAYRSSGVVSRNA